MAIIDDYGAIAKRLRELKAVAPLRAEATTGDEKRQNLTHAVIAAQLAYRARTPNNSGSIMPRSVPIYVGKRGGGANSMD